MLSPEATELTNRVQTAVEYAANSYDLGTRLSPVLDASSRLNPIDKEIVQATISVAQSSYEYWEQEDASMQDQFYEDYGTCVTETHENSYSNGRRARCLPEWTSGVHDEAAVAERCRAEATSAVGVDADTQRVRSR